MMVVKNRSLTTNMNPHEKQKARRRNPEGENSGQTPGVLPSAREDPFLGTFRRKGPYENTQGLCRRNTETSIDTLALARREIKELKKSLKGALMQLDIFEANGGHKTPTVLPTVNGILNHLMEMDHKHHPMQDATFLE